MCPLARFDRAALNNGDKPPPVFEHCDVGQHVAVDNQDALSRSGFLVFLHNNSMPAIYEHTLTVVPGEIDRLGHVNNLAYLAWMQAAALAHSAAQGWPPEKYETLGAGWVVRSHEIKYLTPAFVAESIVVRTWVADMAKVASTRRYKILRASDQALLASAATQWAFVDYTNGTLRRIPEEVWQSFEIAKG